MKKTICELFAGVGGFRCGFEAADKAKANGWETVWFSQWEPSKTKQHAHDCYVAHFGDIDERTGIDIAKVDKALIPDHNLLVGGFPCQDYSVARPLPGSKGINGKKGVLWWQIRDILQTKEATFGLFENVDRLLKSPASQRGRDFGIILSCLASLGYSAEWRVINAADYGAAQRRRRVFIFAYKNTSAYAQALPEDPEKTMLRAGMMAKAFPVNTLGPVSTSELNFEDIPSISENYAFGFENAGVMREGTVWTAKATPRFETPIPLKDIMDRNVDDKYFLGKELGKWEYLKGAKKVERTSKSGHTYTFSEGPIAFPDPVDLPARTMLTSESSLNRSTHVVQDLDTQKLRLLTPDEADKIQGFPAGWTAAGGMPEKFRYFCMGNALVVPMITRMAKQLDKIFKAEP